MVTVGAKKVQKNFEIIYNTTLVETVMTQVGWNADSEDVDVTNFGSEGDQREFLDGYKNSGVNFGFWWAREHPDRDFWYKTSGFPVIWSPDRPGVAGDSGLAYFMEVGNRGTYNPNADAGAVPRGSINCRPQGGVVRGRYLSVADIADSATGAVAAGVSQLEYDGVYGVPQGRNLVIIADYLEVETAIQIDIESASDSIFTTPVLQVALDSKTAEGFQIVRIPGPITDEYFRANVKTATGLTKARVVAGII